MQSTILILKYMIAVIVVACIGGGVSYFLYTRSHQNVIATAPDHVTEPTAEITLGNPLPTETGSAASSSSNQAHASGGGVRFWRASPGPVAGFSFASEGTTSPSHLLFAERASGNVFDADAISQHVLRLTNTLIPKTYEAIFSPQMGTVALRTIESGSITTLLGSFATPISTSTFPNSLGGPTLPINIRSLAIDTSLAKSPIFYLVQGRGGVSGELMADANTKAKTIFSSTIGSWRALMAAGVPIVLESPTDGVAGYAYAISQNGTRSLLVGPVLGLQILPHPSKPALLFSSSSGGKLALFAQIGKGTPTVLPLETIAEKCAWAPGSVFVAYCAVPHDTPESGFLDAWYQGTAHTSDTLWQINVASGTTQEIYTPNTPIDVQNPTVDSTGTYLAFANGADMSLWILHIAQ